MNEDICSICYESLETEDHFNKIYNLECNHRFHTECIMKWFRNKNSTCPLCNDSINYELNYIDKITALNDIKKLGRNQKCPTKIKRILLKLEKNKIKQKESQLELKNFKNTYKKQLKEYSKLNSNKWKFARKKRLIERELIGFIKINPIYIIKKHRGYI